MSATRQLFPGQRWISRKDAREYVEGARANAPGFKLQNKEPDFLIINGLQVFRFTLVSLETPSKTDAMIVYVTVGDRWAHGHEPYDRHRASGAGAAHCRENHRIG